MTAFYGFKGWCEVVVLGFVIARHHPDLVVARYANLGRARNVASRVPAKPYAIDFNGFFVFNLLKGDVISQSLS